MSTTIVSPSVTHLTIPYSVLVSQGRQDIVSRVGVGVREGVGVLDVIEIFVIVGEAANIGVNVEVSRGFGVEFGDFMLTGIDDSVSISVGVGFFLVKNEEKPQPRIDEIKKEPIKTLGRSCVSFLTGRSR